MSSAEAFAALADTLNARAWHVLQALEVTTVDGLCRYSEMDLLRQPNCGRKTLDEIKEGLAVIGRHLSLTNSCVLPSIKVFYDFGADPYPPA